MAEHKYIIMIAYFWNWFIVAWVVIKGISSTSTSPFVSRNAFAIRRPKNNKAIDNFQCPSLPLSLTNKTSNRWTYENSDLSFAKFTSHTSWFVLYNTAKLTAYCRKRKLTFFIQFGTFCKEVFWACIESVPMEIMRLKKSCPEFPLCHVMWNIFCIFHFYCKQASNDYKVFCKS